MRQNLSRFDVVIIHGLWQYASYAVTKVMRQLRGRSPSAKLPRVYVMPHGMLDPWFQNDPSRRVKAWRNWIYWKLIEHRTISNAESLLFTCQKELELARLPFRPYRPKQEINVGYGVANPPTESLSMKRAFAESCPHFIDQPYLLFLSRLHPKKGVDLLIQAYARWVKQETIGEKIPTLIIAGPTDSDYAHAMQRLAASHELLGEQNSPSREPRIIFSGMLQGDAKWGAFYGCEAFVLPSHQENFGIAIVEALACCKPVLISDQVNICTEIAQDGAGLVCPDTLDGTTALLNQWQAKSPEQRALMGQAAKDCFENHFRIKTAAKSLLDAISRDPKLNPSRA
nr:glycosyltransferase [Crateriforma conspicua]